MLGLDAIENELVLALADLEKSSSLRGLSGFYAAKESCSLAVW